MSWHYYPETSSCILHDFYVDDLLTGAHSVSDLIKKQQEISTVLANGCFDLRKWASNSPEFTQLLDSNLCSGIEHQITGQVEAMTLGLRWNTRLDDFSFSIPVYSEAQTPNKRLVLSRIACIFDPFSWSNNNHG
jgi:hypothetical protein